MAKVQGDVKNRIENKNFIEARTQYECGHLWAPSENLFVGLVR
jgi:hypothetical protein